MNLTGLTAADHDEVASLIHRSLVGWYQKNLGQGERFGDRHEPFRLFPEVYDELDPGECIVARDEKTGKLLGVCFVHPRETHFSIGIVATDPDVAGRGTAKIMMQRAIQRASAEGKPVRLVSSALNLDSFSLYTRLGFVPRTLFQDMLMRVPETGLAVEAPEGVSRVRIACPEEAAELADFEQTWQGIRREKDCHFFLNDQRGNWKIWVLESADGALEGFLVVSLNPAFAMLGPGVVGTESAAAALLWRALDDLRGRTYVFLVPCSATGLVRTLYAWGARNVELHVSQIYGDSPVGTGISFPTFLPESA